LSGFAVSSFAQSTKTASATATLITPLSISKTTDLDFGTLAATDNAGTAILDYASAVTVSGGTRKISGTPTTAVFHVIGEGTNTITISFPTPINLNAGAATNLSLALTCDKGASTQLISGATDLKFGGTLSVPANTVAGQYTNSTGISVTVNYQ